jgi:hypothetical protein
LIAGPAILLFPPVLNPPILFTRLVKEDPVSQDINVLALVKGAERYVFLYDDASRSETLRVLGRYASNPELSFTWYDAAVLSQKIRKESQKHKSQRRFEIPMPSDTDELI